MPSISPAATAPPATRPGLVKRHSTSTVTSPSTAGEHLLRHARPTRHAKVVLPRNANSGRKLQQQQATTEEARRHARQRSHEGDTEIRLPGSLDDRPPPLIPPPMRRNMTAYQLPRASSHVKLKKNLSHGQLTRLSSGKNLSALTSMSQKAPPSPGLKGKFKRPKSADMGIDLHEQEVDLIRRRTDVGAAKKVGFAVGSDEESEVDGMEDSGAQEDEWTEESASASPYSTRQNTANNSRRASMNTHERLLDRTAGPLHAQVVNGLQHMDSVKEQEAHSEERDTSTQSTKDEDSEQPVSPHGSAFTKQEVPSVTQRSSLQQPVSKVQRSPLHAAKDYPAAATQRVLNHSQQLPAPAIVSNESAHNDSPAQSIQDLRSTMSEAAGSQEDELISRFIPSTSHPSTGSGGNAAAVNTPKQGSYQTPDEDSAIHAAGTKQGAYQQPSQPTSPGSTRSGSSGVITPAFQRSRIELRMMAEKAAADMEESTSRGPAMPYHYYDRRNEFMKYGGVHSSGYGMFGEGPDLGQEFFQGRFNAVNKELRVVKMFRDPYGESVARLKQCKSKSFARRNIPQKQLMAAGLKASKSSATLARSKLSTSTSPPRGVGVLAPGSPPAGGLVMSKSSVQIAGEPKRGVSFAGTTLDSSGSAGEKRKSEEIVETGPEAVARMLWESVG